MSKVDFSLIAQRALGSAQSIVQQLFPNGRLEGQEWRLGGLDGSSASKKGSLSINVKTGMWSDFATDSGGRDLISLLAARDNLSQVEAARKLSEMIGAPVDRLETTRKVSEFKPELTPPYHPKSHKHYRHGEPDSTWKYRDANGNVMFYIHRFNRDDGAKEICPQVFGEYEGKTRWFWRGVPDNRPLYGLHRLKMSSGNVIIVEGEKCADALAEIANNKAACLSWCGGTSSVAKSDWTPLKGRKVVIWPDNDRKCYTGTEKLKPKGDQPGYKAAQQVAYHALKAGAEDVIIMEIDQDEHPDGWDVADAIESGWSFKDCVAFMKKGIEAAKKKQPQDDKLSHEEKVEKQRKVATKGLDRLPFDCLGYNMGTMYYRPHQTQQIKPMNEAQHTRQNFYYMAELSDWKAAYPKSKAPYWDYEQAASDMMKKNRDMGVFEMENIRGRGAWNDNGRIIMHCGDKLSIDGVIQDSLTVPESNYIYELKNGFSPPSDECVTDEEARELLEHFKKFRWKKDTYGELAFGWSLAAPYCGALDWRPHIWINGTAGAGKTWIVKHVFVKIVGDFALNATSSSTEAGIRSALKSDARPVILDEAEAQDAEGVRRNQKLAELQRQASSDSDARIMKGQSGGGSINYTIRSMFCKASIGMIINQEADETRNTILELDKAEMFDTQVIEQQKQMFAEAGKYFKGMSREFVDKIHGRTHRHLKLILDGVKVFRSAGATLFGSQRHGDQIGTLYGFGYMWINLKIPTEQEAIQYLQIHKAEELIVSSVESDDRRCLDHLFDQQIVIRSEKKNAQFNMMIAEIIEALRFDINLYGDEWNTCSEHPVSPKECENALAQCGLRLDAKEKLLYVANNHVWLRTRYKDTQWADMGWANSLKQIDNADNNDGKALRIAGTSRKCTRIRLPEKDD